jgi:hypothetical protein
LYRFYIVKFLFFVVLSSWAKITATFSQSIFFKININN